MVPISQRVPNSIGTPRAYFLFNNFHTIHRLEAAVRTLIVGFIDYKSAVYAYLATISPSHHLSLISTGVQQSSSLHVQGIPTTSTLGTRKLPIGIPAMLTVTVSLFTFLLFLGNYPSCSLRVYNYRTAWVSLSHHQQTLMNPFERRRFSLESIIPRALFGI